MSKAQQPPPQFTVRWEQLHTDVLDGVAAQLGMSRQHMAAGILAQALGLPRPARVPAVPLDLNALADLAADEQARLEEVLPRSA